MTSWEPGALSDPPPATEEAVRAAERLLRVRFPADHLAVARAHQGARPVPAAYTLPDGSVSAVGHLLHFEPAPLISSISAFREFFLGVLQKGVIPFAVDIGGDPICFSFRADYDAPPVVHWSVDTGPITLAPTFTAFIASLHD